MGIGAFVIFNVGNRIFNFARYFTENIMREIMPHAYCIDILPQFSDRKIFNNLPNYSILPIDNTHRELIDKSLSEFVNEIDKITLD